MPMDRWGSWEGNFAGWPFAHSASVHAYRRITNQYELPSVPTS